MEQYGGQTERERRTDGGSRAKRVRRTDGAACGEQNGGRGVKASGACAGQALGARAGQAEQKGQSERARAGGASVFFAGCSAFVWESEEGLRFFGRNFDFDRFDAGSRVLFLPRGEEIALRLGEGVRETMSAKYAVAGMGTLSLPVPVLYDGVNECGLAGGQLYFRERAHYAQSAPAGRAAVQPGLALTCALASCASVEEAVAAFTARYSLVAEPLMGAVPPLHWFFADRTGASAVLEPAEDGVRVFRGANVMTNSPSYGWHRENLLNYAHIRAQDYAETPAGAAQPPCFSGSGAQGLPGDWSSPSRFVRLSFLRGLCVRGRGEEETAAYTFRLLENVAFPLGMVRVHAAGGRLEEGVSPYDHTVYSCVAGLHSLRYYWTSYRNSSVRYIDLAALREGAERISFCVDDVPAFRTARREEMR